MTFHRIFSLWLSCLVFLIFIADSNATEPANWQSLSLDQAIKTALEHNHDLQLSVFALKAAEAGTEIAAAAPNPVLTAQTYNINPNAGVGSGNFGHKTVDSTVHIDQLIERGGKREFRKEAATHLEDAAREDLQDARRQLRIAVSQSYYNLLAAQERLRLTLDTVDLYDNSVAAAKKRLQAGDIASVDVARLQVDALRANNDATQAESDCNTARLALALLLGRIEYAAQIRAVDDWPTTPTDSSFLSSDLVDQWIERRPDVRAARARLDGAVAASKLAQASRTHDITVGFQYEHYPSSLANPQGSGNSFGISLQIPLFLRNQFNGEVRAAGSAVDSTREMLEKTREQARQELLQSAAGVRSSYERIRRYDDSLLMVAKKSADAAEFAFKHGSLGVMDVLDARRTYRSIQLDALAARADYAKALAAWRAAVIDNRQL